MFGDEAFFNFILLPLELQVVILSGLALYDLSVITAVSRALHDIVRNTPVLQYPIELIACGVQDNPRSTSAMAERLNNLRQHDQAWRTLSWTESISFTVPPGGGVHSRQGLVLLATERSHPELGLDVHQLPAKTRNIPGLVWVIEPRHDQVPQGQGSIYEVDASQDLLVIRHSTTRDAFFNVFALSDGHPHPQAAQPKFRISNNSAAGVGHAGSTAGAYIRRDWIYLFDQQFEIYNWKLGERAMNLSRFSMLDECAFVSDRYLATLCVSHGPSPAGLLMFELPQSDPSIPLRYPANIPVLAFLLPEIDADQDTETRWELIGGSAQSPTDNSLTSGGDFTAKCDDTLLVILFRVDHQWYELVTPTQRLLGFLPNPANISMNATMLALREVLWTEWGPQNTRVRGIAFRGDGQDRTKVHASLFGMRRVLYHPVYTPAGLLAARVEDYQTHRVRRAEACESSSGMVHHGDMAQGSWLDGGELHTVLPFMVTDLILPDKWQGRPLEDVDISIHGDGIIIAEREHGQEHEEALTL